MMMRDVLFAALSAPCNLKYEADLFWAMMFPELLHHIISI